MWGTSQASGQCRLLPGLAAPRRGEPPQVAVLVVPGATAVEAGSRELGAEEGVLASADLDQQRASWTQQPRRRGHHAPDDLEAVVATIEGAPRLVALHVGREQAKVA